MVAQGSLAAYAATLRDTFRKTRVIGVVGWPPFPCWLSCHHALPSSSVATPKACEGMRPHGVHDDDRMVHQ